MRAGAGQRGGAAILVAFLLLTLMAGLGLATCRNLDRELAMLSDAAQGARAAAAAESALAWFLDRAASVDPATIPAPPEGLLDEGPEAGYRQGFELRVHGLGALGRPGEEPAERLWRVTAIGRCGARGQAQGEFIQVRELLAAGAQAPDRPGPLRILAWSARAGP